MVATELFPAANEGRSRSSGWQVIAWLVLSMLSIERLFTLPGLIARNHEGFLGRLLGPWFTWTLAILSAAVCVGYTIARFRNWFHHRSSGNQVR